MPSCASQFASTRIYRFGISRALRRACGFGKYIVTMFTECGAKHPLLFYHIYNPAPRSSTLQFYFLATVDLIVDPYRRRALTPCKSLFHVRPSNRFFPSFRLAPDRFDFRTLKSHISVHDIEMSSTFWRRMASTEEWYRSDTVKLATWILLGFTVAMFVARQVMKAIVFRRVTLDDYLMLFATVIAPEMYERSLLTNTDFRYWPICHSLYTSLRRPRCIGSVDGRASQYADEGLLCFRISLYCRDMFLETVSSRSLLHGRRWTTHSAAVDSELRNIRACLEYRLTVSHCVPMQPPATLGDDDLTMLQHSTSMPTDVEKHNINPNIISESSGSCIA
jgi:hypothetical protein